MKTSDKRYRSIYDAGDTLRALTPDQKRKLLSYLPSLYKTFANQLPYLICGSVMDYKDVGIKIPVQAILNLTLDQIIDEYFGYCYQPSRAESRYEDGFVEQVGAKIREDLPLADFLTRNSSEAEGARATGSLSDLIDIYGLQECKNWWRNASEDQIKKLRDEEMTDYMYESFVDESGGGLIDENTGE